ncbi:MAG: S8 family serine peptidase, partial [Bacteroidota bacterium]
MSVFLQGVFVYGLLASCSPPNDHQHLPVSYTIDVETLPRADALHQGLSSDSIDLPEQIRPRYTDDFVPMQWALRNDGTDPFPPYAATKPSADAKVLEALDAFGQDMNYDVTVAIIDGPVDAFHPELDGQVLGTYNAFTDQFGMKSDEAGADHHTMLALIIGAKALNGGMMGIAPMTQLLLINGMSFEHKYLERAFDLCLRQRADIVNLSWGHKSRVLNQASVRSIFDFVKNGRGGKGGIVVVAAGNEGLDKLNTLADIPGVIVVGASNFHDELSSYSNRGPKLSLVAPGSSLSAPARWNNREPKAGLPPGYCTIEGTSVSAAIVSGVCALMLSVNPELTSDQVKQILIKSA